MKLLKIAVAIIILIIIFDACKHEPLTTTVVADPGTGGTGGTGTGSTLVCFQSEVLPLFQSNCAKSGCHDAISRQKGYVLDTYANIIKDGIVPGRATNSDIYKVLFETGNKKMPPSPNADLTSAQKAIIGKWINEGAKNTINCGSACDTTQFKYAANISPILASNCVGCHGGTTPSAGITLNTYMGVRAQAINGRLYGAVTHSPGYSPMPKNAAKLTECQLTQIKKWIDVGALNN